MPIHLEFVPGGIGLPPGLGHHGDTGHQAGQVLRAFDHEDVRYSRELPDFFDIGLADFSAEHGALLEHGVQHAVQAGVRSEQGLPGQDFRVVHAGDETTQQGELFRAAFQFQLRNLGRRHFSRRLQP